MAAPDFFLSYARDDDDPLDDGSTLVRELFEDLCTAISRETGQRPSAGKSFIDAKISVGARWEDAIHDAACRCEVFVPLLSPSYFMREWCGREWAIVQERLAAVAGERPRRIVPLIWHPYSELPAIVASYQRTLDDKNRVALRNAFADYTEMGLSWLVRFRKTPPYHVAYAHVVREVARQIRHAAQRGELPALDVARAKTVAAQFGAQCAAPSDDADREGYDDDADAYFAAVVGRRDEIARDQIRSRYATSRWRWRPFAPDSAETIGATLTRIAAEARLRPDWLKLTPHLASEIRRHEAKGRAVIVVVDAWSTEVGDCLARAQELDRELFSNCSFLLVWSDDPGGAPRPVQHVHTLALQRRTANRLVEEATDPATLIERLTDMLQHLQERLAVVRGPQRELPSGSPTAIPTISATLEVGL